MSPQLPNDPHDNSRDDSRNDSRNEPTDPNDRVNRDDRDDRNARDESRQPAPDELPLSTHTLFTYGFWVEFSMVFIAAAIAYIVLGRPFPFELRLEVRGLLLGVAAAAPAALFAVLATSRLAERIGFLRTIYERLRGSLGPAISGLAVWEIWVLSAAAGLGEEVLFRGVLQHEDLLGLWLASVFFGLLHALSLGYFVVATGIGLYLGWLYLATENLIVPVIVHWLYDVVALTLFQRRFRREKHGGSPT